MKAQIFIALIMVLATVLGCAKKEDESPEDSNTAPELELVKTVYKGCFINKAVQDGSDTLYYSFNGDSLILNVSLNYNCCGLLTDSVSLATNKVSIYIADSNDYECDCMCPFEFEYYFRNFNDISFYVYLKGLNESEYTLWKEIL